MVVQGLADDQTGLIANTDARGAASKEPAILFILFSSNLSTMTLIVQFGKLCLDPINVVLDNFRSRA